jgi:hypothetical protein
MTESSKQRVMGGVLAVFLAFVQFRQIALVLHTDYAHSVEAAWGVVIGHPHWRMFQSRILGPYLVLGLSGVLPENLVSPANAFMVAHVLYSIATLSVAGYLAFRLGRTHGGDLRSALLALAVFEMGFAFLLSPPWLYAWDYLDIIIFFVFVDFVLAEREWQWFVGLYFAAIWNRDSAQFIALWMCLDALCRWALGRLGKVRPRPFDWRKLASGTVLIPIGATILETLRRTMLIQEIGPLIFPDRQHEQHTLYFGMTLGTNLREAQAALSFINPTMPIVVPLFVLLAIILAIAVARRDPPRLLAFGLVYLLMTAAEVLFAGIYETRTLVVFVPLVVSVAVILSGPRERRDAVP